VVAQYDSDRGLGFVVAGDESFRFHATAIADGSRQIEAGRRVTFVLAPGPGGVLEARGLTPVPA
jgi:cold shock CspA family protein